MVYIWIWVRMFAKFIRIGIVILKLIHRAAHVLNWVWTVYVRLISFHQILFIHFVAQFLSFCFHLQVVGMSFSFPPQQIHLKLIIIIIRKVFFTFGTSVDLFVHIFTWISFVFATIWRLFMRVLGIRYFLSTLANERNYGMRQILLFVSLSSQHSSSLCTPILFALNLLFTHTIALPFSSFNLRHFEINQDTCSEYFELGRLSVVRRVVIFNNVAFPIPKIQNQHSTEKEREIIY